MTALLPLVVIGTACAAPPASPVRPMFKTLPGNIPPAVSGATALGTRYDPQAKVDIALTLPFRDKAGLDDYTTHLFDPADPLYHHYLTPQEITARFGPTQANFDAVVAFAKSQGLTVTHTSSNRMLVDVSASTTLRDVPDVALNAYTDYAIYYNGAWQPYGGTSAATPIWASFLALVNSRLVPEGVPPLADLPATLYTIAKGTRYTTDFHDIADGSNNRLFSGGPGNSAVPGYDLTTGLGSFNGANLFADLVAAAGGR